MYFHYNCLIKLLFKNQIMYTSINIIAIAIALVMNMIQGYTLNGLNNTEKIFSFDGSQISMITVGN